MIKSIEFKYFRNITGKYIFDNNLNVIIGKNNSGKTNLLDGIKLAFSVITNDYFRIADSDFKDSNTSNPIQIKVELRSNTNIPSFKFLDENSKEKCGFKVVIIKTKSGRYIKKLSYLNGSNIDMDIVREDENIPNIYSIPLIRIEDIYSKGLAAGMSNLISTEEKYKNIREESKKAIKKELKIKLIEVDNTIETDLYNNGFLNDFANFLKSHKKHSEIYIAKEKKKMEIVERLITSNVSLANWHIIRELEDEFKSN